MKPPKILVIEDDKDIRRNMKLLLESEGYEVEIASNGEEGLKILENATTLPALIILDLMMPVMDGFEFRRAQQMSAKISHIPVAIMTADGHVVEKQAKLNAVAGISKPPDVETVIRITTEILAKAN